MKTHNFLLITKIHKLTITNIELHSNAACVLCGLSIKMFTLRLLSYLLIYGGQAKFIAAHYRRADKDASIL